MLGSEFGIKKKTQTWNLAQSSLVKVQAGASGVGDYYFYFFAHFLGPECHLNYTAYLSAAAEHVHPFMNEKTLKLVVLARKTFNVVCPFKHRRQFQRL